VTSRFSAGSNKLLADGARMVTCAQDLLDELYGVGSPGPCRASPRDPDESTPRDPKEGRTRDPGVGGEPAPRALDAPAVARDPVEERVLDALEAGLGIEGVCAHSGLPAREARALLARLEASGLLRRDGLGGYRRSAPRAITR